LLALPAALDRGAVARGMTGYGGIVYWQGEYERAEEIYSEALNLYRVAGDRQGEALALFDLGFTMSVTKKMAEASAALSESERIYAELGDEKGRLQVAEGRAAVALLERELDVARAIAESVVDDYRRLGMRYRMVDTLGLLIGVYLEQGDLPKAQSRWTEWASAWLELGDFSAQALVFEFGARMSLDDGRPRDAAVMLGALQQLRDRGEPFLVPGEVMGLRAIGPEIRAGLRADEFDAAFAEGRAMPRHEATLMAIEVGRAHSRAV